MAQQHLTARTQLKSSMIAHVDYNAEDKTLTVGFHDGGHYTYQDVPQLVHDELVAAPSAGRYFHSNIRGVYGTTRQHGTET